MDLVRRQPRARHAGDSHPYAFQLVGHELNKLAEGGDQRRDRRFVLLGLAHEPEAGRPFVRRQLFQLPLELVGPPVHEPDRVGFETLRPSARRGYAEQRRIGLAAPRIDQRRDPVAAGGGAAAFFAPPRGELAQRGGVLPAGAGPAAQRQSGQARDTVNRKP
ncbi:hypothetical protein D3C81_1757770 [compost metagenome]